ncbi:MAG: sensor histidine kinase [Alphaproteobacteria bacterium]|nr:sensor histidine kinase [Alphaproteobacteria bacterium]
MWRALPRSLVGRLVLAAGIWIVVSLVAAGVLLDAALSDRVDYDVRRDAEARLGALIGATSVGADGKPILQRPHGDIRYQEARSGVYWQIHFPDGDTLRSRSLGNETLPAAPNPDPLQIEGPDEQQLVVMTRTLLLPGAQTPFTFSVAVDRTEIEEYASRFAGSVSAALALLGVGLLVAVVVQIRIGLRPLAAVGRALAQVRAGQAAEIPGNYPGELQPLVDEINQLVRHNATVMERARTHVGNLAHALKTPISVLAARASIDKGALADVVRTQTTIMSKHVEHHLARASMAGPEGGVYRRTPVGDVIGDLARTLAQIHARRDIEIDVDVTDQVLFRGERQDLEEMVGNLMDNACKWAGSRVRVTAKSDGGRLLLVVEDDGPGMPEAFHGEAFQRGRRLDESVPGSGHGLAIVRDLTQLYGGRVTLGRSHLGGLAATLDLPAPAEAAV